MQRSQELWARPSPMGSSSSHISPWALVTNCGWYYHIPGPLASRRQAGQLSRPLPGAPHHVPGCLDGPAPQGRAPPLQLPSLQSVTPETALSPPELWLHPCQPGWVALGCFPPCGPVMPAIPFSHSPPPTAARPRLQATGSAERETEELNLSF